MKTFVVTDPELGWQCVLAVYQAKSAEVVRETFLNDNRVNDDDSIWDSIVIQQVGKIQGIE